MLKNVTLTIHATPGYYHAKQDFYSECGQCVCRHVSKFQKWPKEVKRRSRFVKNAHKNEISFYLLRNKHCLKSVQTRSFSGPYFTVFGLNLEKYSVSLRIQSDAAKYRPEKTPFLDTFHAVKNLVVFIKLKNIANSHFSSDKFFPIINSFLLIVIIFSFCLKSICSKFAKLNGVWKSISESLP